MQFKIKSILICVHFLLQSGQINPPHNLSRTRYQNMLDLIPGMKYVRKRK